MREEYLDAISELEESLSPFHLESDGEWTNYEFNTSTIRVAIESLEKQVAKKPDYEVLHDNSSWIHCTVCNQVWEEQQRYCHYCGQKINWEETP